MKRLLVCFCFAVFAIALSVYPFAAETVDSFDNSSVTIDTSDIVEIYKNTFDNASALADFTQYRGTWSVFAGKLYLSAATGTQSYILYGGRSDLVNLSDYVVDVDMYNTQTQGGVIIRSDYANVTGATDDGFKGYLMFVSNNGMLCAIGAGKADGKWLDGNIEVSSSVMQPGMDIHLQAAVKGNLVQYTVTELGSGRLLWKWCEVNDLWAKGTFGFRLRSKATNTGLSNLNTTAFDNLVVSVFADTPVAGQNGDSNKDGVINTRDATRILQYIAGFDIEIDLAAADVTGDGIVTLRDAARLLQYLAGWNVSLG